MQERQKQLESLGISLRSSGIKVGDDKCFLVNLNADPALNELLVYYLKVPADVGLFSPPEMSMVEVKWCRRSKSLSLSPHPQDHTKVGSADSQDIQLCGMGIQAEHCIVDITSEAAVVLTPRPNAR